MVEGHYFIGDLIMVFRLFFQSKINLGSGLFKISFKFNKKTLRFNKDNKLEVIVVTSVDNEDKFYLPHVT